MKAYRLHAVGDLRYEEVPTPECPPGWSIVQVKATGVCSSDVPRIFTKGTYHYPTIPGHELAGVVKQVADEKDRPLLGKKVGVFPLIPCRKCEFCSQGRYELCTNYDYIGSRRDGGFAEEVAVPVWNLIQLDEAVSFIDAAMMEPLAVSLHAVNQIELKGSENVAVIGTGMIAFAAAQWIMEKGACSATVIGRSETKKHIAEAIGGIEYATYQNCGSGYDAVLEAVGSNEAIDRSINLLKPGGVLVLMGNPEGDILLRQDTYWKILRRQLIVKGTWNSSYEQGGPSDWETVRDYLNKGKIKVNNLVSHTFDQNHLQEALVLMHEHKEPYCKVMTLWNKE